MGICDNFPVEYMSPMKLFPLIMVLILMLWEIKVLRGISTPLFSKHFSVSQQKCIFLIIFFCLMGILPDGDILLSALILVAVIPLYIIRRNRLITEHDPTAKSISKDILLSQGIGIIIQWLYFLFVASMATRVLLEKYDNINSKFLELIISAGLSSIIIYVLIYIGAKRFSDNGFNANVSLIAPPNAAKKIFVIPLGVGIIFATVSAGLLVNRKVQPDTPLNDIISKVDSPSLILLFLFLALIIAPFIEEITFRGYFYRLIKEIRGRRFAFVVISLTFGGLHMHQYWGDWIAITMVGLLGFVLTFLRVWSGSTLSSVVTHYAYNIGVTILPVIFLVSSNPAYFKYQAYYNTYDAATKEQLLKEAIIKDPELADAYNDLAWLYVEEGIKLLEALELVNKALTFNDQNEAYLDTKAAVLEGLDRGAEASVIRRQLDEMDRD